MQTLRILGTILGSIALALLCTLMPVLMVRFALVPLLEMATTLGPEALAVFRRVAIIAGIACGLWFYIRMFERRHADELRFRPGPIAISGFLGSIWVGVPMVVLFLAGFYQVSSLGTFHAAIGLALVIFAAALLEEAIFRAVLFRVLLQRAGVWWALIVPSVIFSSLHVFNDNWAGWLSLSSVLLLGVMWSLVFLLTNNLWAAALNHACWNFTIFASGLPLTGQQDWRPLAPMQSDFAGPDIWTGGAAGPENSLLVIVCILGIVLSLLWRMKRRRQFRLPERPLASTLVNNFEKRD